MPKNKIFDRSGEDHVVMEVTKLVVVTSLFGKDKYLCLKVNNIGYTSQAGGTERLFVEKTSICRSTFDASFSSAITSEAVRAIDTGL